MPTATRVDPYGSNHFRVEIDGITASDFTEVSGLEAAVTVVDYLEGMDKALGRGSCRAKRNIAMLC
jgi:hypothetical protein